MKIPFIVVIACLAILLLVKGSASATTWTYGPYTYTYGGSLQAGYPGGPYSGGYAYVEGTCNGTGYSVENIDSQNHTVEAHHSAGLMFWNSPHNLSPIFDGATSPPDVQQLLIPYQVLNLSNVTYSYSTGFTTGSYEADGTSGIGDDKRGDYTDGIVDTRVFSVTP